MRAKLPWRRVGSEVIVASREPAPFRALRGAAAVVWLLLDEPLPLGWLARGYTEAMADRPHAGARELSLAIEVLREAGLVQVRR